MSTGQVFQSGVPGRSTRQRLIDSAVRLFQTRGFHGTGLAEILDDAGLPKGSLYHAFPGGKDELAVGALGWLDGEVGALLDRGAELGWSGEETALRMARHVEAGLRDPEDARGSLFAVLAQDACPRSAAITQALGVVLAGWEGRLAARFSATGDDRSSTGRARLALALLEGGALVARVRGRPGVVSEIMKAGLGIV